MSKIKNGELDQYGAEPFEQQQFGPAGVERVNILFSKLWQISCFHEIHLMTLRILLFTDRQTNRQQARRD